MSDVLPDDYGLLQCGDLSAWPMTTLMEASVRTLMRVSSAVGASVDATLGRVDIDGDDAQALRRKAWRAQARAGALGAARRLRKAAPSTLRVLALFLQEIESEQQRTR